MPEYGSRYFMVRFWLRHERNGGHMERVLKQLKPIKWTKCDCYLVYFNLVTFYSYIFAMFGSIYCWIQYLKSSSWLIFHGNPWFSYVAGFGKKYSTGEIDYPKNKKCMC